MDRALQAKPLKAVNTGGALAFYSGCGWFQCICPFPIFSLFLFVVPVAVDWWGIFSSYSLSLANAERKHMEQMVRRGVFGAAGPPMRCTGRGCLTILVLKLSR